MTGVASLVLVMAAAALVPLLVEAVGRWVRVAPVVFELLLGILIGPVLHWATDEGVVSIVAAMGLATLMFLAGAEVDLARVWGTPLRLAVVGWLSSLVIGVVVALALRTAVALPLAVVALAVTTSALGTMLPILRDSRLTPTRFGAIVMAAAAVGEVGPVIALSFAVSSDAGRTTLELLGYAALAVAALVLAARPLPEPVGRVLGSTLHSSGQFAVRVAVLLLLLLVWTSTELGFDVLLGAFTAGLLYRRVLDTRPREEVEVVSVKLDGIGFGFFVPAFFVVSGIRFDVASLVSDPRVLLLLPLFVVAFLVVRGLPTYVLSRGVLDRAGRAAVALFVSAQLPLVVVVTSLAVSNGRLPSGVAAAMVGAGMVSVVVFPLVAVRLVRTADVGR